MLLNLEKLPHEILLQVLSLLPPLDIVHLQYVSRRLLQVARDDKVWREETFWESTFVGQIRRRREAIVDANLEEPRFADLAIALAAGNGLNHSRLQKSGIELKAQETEKLRLRVNWDPCFPNEKVEWYKEYIARHAPIQTNWLEQPRSRESPEHECLEARGVALYKPETGITLVVAPLDDGSIVLWNLCGAQGAKGNICSRSKAGLLSVGTEAPVSGGRYSKTISIGVTECITVDSARKRAYVAVQSSLVEVDLESLSAISQEDFGDVITALSEARYPTPITVGTSQAIYLYDTRASQRLYNGYDNRVESQFHHDEPSSSTFRRLINGDLSLIHAPLYQPGPLNILHMPSGAGESGSASDDIYIAGRFPSILNYDRRSFPRLRGTIHSGASLAALASIPYPFSSLDKDLATRGELSTEQVLEYKSRPGHTLIACGEYNSKGSLEVYGISPETLFASVPSISDSGRVYNAVLKNRQTASSSKLLSATSHGTSIVMSDGGGNLKWMERDGRSEIRRYNIAHGSTEAPRGIFGTLGDSYLDSGSGDIVIKILENDGELVLWTGERIGLLRFSAKPGFTSESFQNIVKTAEEARQEREEQIYSDTMRRALEHHAKEMRYVQRLGFGL
ncbi:hypothetical protein BJ878DRAFT_544232 [Calycina marina]|uniref:F-box domain-containing protein n=1 Tax=Calycina marina TaxID=1763456 RepID=A0A9P8CD85_9HELO|nr:hypothetical protein BJ878DRAFT_544232 [Calycina marina]